MTNLIPKDYIATTEQFEVAVDNLAEVADFLSVEFAAFEVPTVEEATEAGIPVEDIAPLRGAYYKSLIFNDFESETADLSPEDRQAARLAVIQESMESMLIASWAATAAVKVDPDAVIEQIKSLGIHPDPDSVTSESLTEKLVAMDDKMQEAARNIAVVMTGLTIDQMRERLREYAAEALDEEE